jgi:hypothetical protein
MFALLAQLASNSVHYVSIPAAVWRCCCVAVSFIFGFLCFWPCCDIVRFRSNLFFLLRTKVERLPGWFYYLTISSKNAHDHPRILADPMKKDGLLTARRSGSNQLFPFSMPFAADSFFCCSSRSSTCTSPTRTTLIVADCPSTITPQFDY